MQCMRFTKQEHLHAKHDPKQIPVTSSPLTNPYPHFDYKNEKQNKKSPPKNKQACPRSPKGDQNIFCVSIFYQFVNTCKYFKKQNSFNLQKATACYSTELLTKLWEVITEEAQKLYWLLVVNQRVPTQPMNRVGI